MAQRIVVDANLSIALVVPLAYSDAVTKKWLSWEENRINLYTPYLWEYEVVSVLRKAIVAGLLNSNEAESALMRLFSLGIEVIPPAMGLHQSALRWSECIGQPVAYDGQYLALAEALQAEFWTADKKLVDALKNENLPWLHWIGEV